MIIEFMLGLGFTLIGSLLLALSWHEYKELRKKWKGETQ